MDFSTLNSSGATKDAKGKKDVPPASLLDNYPDTSINPYEFMGVERDATEADIKRAYKKGALRWHPDKHPADQKGKAQKAFQRLTTAYAVLVDPVRRRHYDATGKVQDALHMDPNDPWSWQPFYQHCWTKMSHGDVEAFAKEYRHSEEERQDLLKQYSLQKGDMTKICEHVTLSNPLEDDQRYREWINEAIEKGDVKAYDIFTKESARMIRARKDRARREAQEAESLKSDLKKRGKWFEPASNQENTDQLALAIQSKNKSRSVELLDHLMDKYVNSGKKGGKKNSGQLPNEPSEEAFEKNRKKGFQEALERDKLREEKQALEKRKRKAAQVQKEKDEQDEDEDEEEEEEEEEDDPVRKWNERRKRVKQQVEDDEDARQELGEDDKTARKRRREDNIWGKPAKSSTATKAKPKAQVKKKPAATKVGKSAGKTTKAKPRKSKAATVESEEEDDRIELGSEDSDEEEDDENEG